MMATAGLNPSLRLVPPDEPQKLYDDGDIQIEEAAESADKRNLDDDGNTISIEHPDGTLTLDVTGKPLETAEKNKSKGGWFENLIDKIDASELGRIADDLMRGVRNDLMSRKNWSENRALGLKMLGLMIETAANTDTDGVAGQSRVRHPLLLEAVLRFQANARSEMLPVDGPVKIRDDNNNADLESDNLSNALEKDLNHYLTSTATEYYPDTDRMFLMLGFGGTAFKKIYMCPLRNRPVSESVDADDVIVNEAATDLANASRITHRISMRDNTVKRMQILGVYRDVSLPTPKAKEQDAVEQQKKSIEGLTQNSTAPEDNNREIYEIYCELNISGHEHKYKGEISGLEIPYRVTIDVTSNEILSIIRNYDEDSEELPTARQSFVKYTFVPGLGFLDIGLLHILGNTTSAITAAWREMLDAGMFASFPGFLYADSSGRQDTNIFRVPPGGGAKVNTQGMPINQAIMPLPYKDPSSALMTLVDNMAQTGQRLGGTSEIEVGEGRADAPVGTTLALIEQKTKLLNSVHKRIHAAQAQEFQLLVQCFRENPKSFWQRNKKPARAWDEATFLKALDEADLVPQADPNTSSHSQRLMKVVALKQLQSASPNLYDAIAVDQAALKAIGWSNPEQFMAPPEVQGKPSPEIIKGEEELRIKKQLADSKQLLDQSQAKKNLAEAAKPPDQPNQPEGLDPLKVAKLKQDQEHLDFQKHKALLDHINEQQEDQTDMQTEKMRLEGDLVNSHAKMVHESQAQAKDHLFEHEKHANQMIHEKGLAAAEIKKRKKSDE